MEFTCLWSMWLQKVGSELNPISNSLRKLRGRRCYIWFSISKASNWYGGADGTILRFIQSVLDPLQQTLADGCHLTRETGRSISKSGFSDVKLSMTSLSSASIINPQLFGIACK